MKKTEVFNFNPTEISVKHKFNNNFFDKTEIRTRRNYIKFSLSMKSF